MKRYEEICRNYEGNMMNYELSTYVWALGVGKNPSYLIYGHETCFYFRVLDGNL